MHFSRSSEVLYFHSESVSVHTDSHTDLERYVSLPPGWYIRGEYKAIRRREREGSKSLWRIVGRYAQRSPKAKLSFFRNGEQSLKVKCKKINQPCGLDSPRRSCMEIMKSIMLLFFGITTAVSAYYFSGHRVYFDHHTDAL